MRRNRHEMETILMAERTHASKDRLTLQQAMEAQKKKLNDLEVKLCEREMEVNETKHSLQAMQDKLEKSSKASAKRLQPSEFFVPNWTPTRVG